MFLLLSFMAFILHLSIKVDAAIISESLCDEKSFIESINRNNKLFHLTKLRERCNSTYHEKCNWNTRASLHLYFTMIENSVRNRYHLRVVADNISEEFLESGCWGIGFEEFADNSFEVQYFSKTKIKKLNKTIVYFDLYYRMGFNYTITVMALPNGRAINFTWQAPGRCELSVMDDIHRLMRDRGTYESCLSKSDLEINFNVARIICNNYHSPQEFYKASNRLDVQDCIPKILEVGKNVASDGSSSNDTITLSLSILAVVMVIMIVTFIVVAKKQNVEFCGKKSSLLSFDQQTSITTNKEQPIVMIVQRDGCEILENMIMELTSLLQSYGVTVKLTTAFENAIDNGGGIASYLQNNINLCDFVFVMVTEKEDRRMNPKHRSYEFAIKMMEGTVVHGCAHAYYLPIYMTSYNKAIKYFPPFLKASTSYGFQIPNDALGLINQLFGFEEKYKSKERKIKDKDFITRLKELSKNYLSSVHPTCNKDYCEKGQHCIISDNVSSIWASTIHTKWQSQDSLTESGIELLDSNEFENENNKEFLFDKV